MGVSPSLADNLLSGVRIKLFTMVASANAKLGQLQALQCLDRNVAVSQHLPARYSF